MRKCILVIDDDESTVISAPGDTVLRDETRSHDGEGCVEMEEGNVEAEEATLVAVHNYLLATEKS